MLLELVKNYKVYYSNTTLVKVKYKKVRLPSGREINSNTTLVKVKSNKLQVLFHLLLHSNTTLVKVKCTCLQGKEKK